MTFEEKIARPEFAALFWSHVQPSSDDKCWPWMKCCSKWGYGVTGFNRQTARANRVAFRLANGYWPTRACHKCDNPICCNPSHLFDGTDSDNMQDMIRKGRGNPARGERSGSNKLSTDQVNEIRRLKSESNLSNRKLGDMFGCTAGLVSMIVNRKRWAHV